MPVVEDSDEARAWAALLPFILPPPAGGSGGGDGKGPASRSGGGGGGGGGGADWLRRMWAAVAEAPAADGGRRWAWDLLDEDVSARARVCMRLCARALCARSCALDIKALFGLSG